MGYFKPQETKKFNLPSDEKYWVEIPTSLRYGDVKKFAFVNESGNIDISAQADLFLEMIIKDWNLDNEQGEVLPVTIDTINQLSSDDAVAIINMAGALVETEEQKKTSTKA